MRKNLDLTEIKGEKDIENNDDEMIDLYGTIVKTNGNFKDLKQQKLPAMIKQKSDNIKKKSKQKKKNKNKPFFGKSYIIKKFINKKSKEDLYE